MTDPREELRLITQSVKDELRRRPGSAVTHWDKHDPAPPMAPPKPAVPSAGPAPDFAATEAALLRLYNEEIGDCQRCPLGASRIKLVFGVGNPQARVLFIGEGPGFQEDRQGEPFVGPAGQLLDKILASVGLSRQRQDPPWSWVYIANIVKCHPMVDPANAHKRGNDRPPTPEESATCYPFLLKQIQIIRPHILVPLGATAAVKLLNTSERISALRGKWTTFSDPRLDAPPIRCLPTFHPSALLRNPALKKDVWEDMKALRTALTTPDP